MRRLVLLAALLAFHACGGSTKSRPGSPSATGCQPVVCDLACEDGFAQDENGCDICSCAPVCEPVTCELYCEDGYATKDGCEVCACE